MIDRMRGVVAAALAIGALALGGSSKALAQEQKAEGWEIGFTPYVWLTAFSGSIKGAAGKQSFNSSFSDVLKATDEIYALMGHLELRNGRFGFYLDASYMHAEAKGDGAVRVKVVNDMTFVDFAGFYRFAEGPAGSSGEKWGVEAVAGVRYADVGFKIDVGPFGGDRSTYWFDPIFGVRALLDLTPRWSVMAHGDIGGFGAGSELTANLLGVARYRFDLWGAQMHAVGGYRALYFDHENLRTGRETKLWIHGPALGLTVRL